MKGWWLLALGVVFGILSAGGVWLASSPPRGAPVQLLPPPTPSPIQVHVTGAVAKPGVYALPVGSRVQDAIESAGGITAEANAQTLNLAAVLEDGFQVWVPSKSPVQESPAAGSSTGQAEIPLEPANPAAPGALININTASQAELESLPGIGPVTAQKIIAYRQANGLFIGIEDIQKVSGIGPATFEKIKDLITTGSAP